MKKTLTPDEIREWALWVVNDFLLDGIEFTTVVENLPEDYPAATDADFEAVYFETRNILDNLRNTL